MVRLKLYVLFCLVLPLVACTPELPARDGVIHLDPRLADGKSSAQALQGGAVRWVEQTEVADSSSALLPWTAQFCQPAAVPDGGPGVALRGNVPEATRIKRIELRSSATYQASDIDFLELELGRTTSGIARVSWRSSLDPAEALFPRSATALVNLSHGPLRLRIALSALPGWAGEISELSIAPKEEGQQRVDLVAIRLGRIGYTFAADPLEDGGDGGLIAQGREARRAWPSDWNVPLYATAIVPRGGRLCVDAGVATNTTDLTAEVHFAVDARPQGRGDWQRVASTSVVPGERAQGSAWEPLAASLKAFEGQEIQLRFLACAGADPNDQGTLDRARLFWGEPLVHGMQPSDRRPNVLLITIDTLRADALGCLRGEDAKSLTPYLDRLAKRGVLFEQAWSACNATSPSHASILTGLAVQDHGLHDNRSILAAQNTTLAERFRAGGWQTGAAVSVDHLTPSRSGLGQGFDRFWLGQQDATDDGAKTIHAFKEWQRGFARDGGRPTFQWLHLFDPHTPYDVPAQFLKVHAARLGVSIPDKTATPATLPETRWSGKGEFLAGVSSREWAEFMYEACVAYSDSLLHELFDELEQLGVLENTIVVVTADHGEALGEHDNWYHHTGLYQEVMHVPLILVLPQGPRGLRIAEPVWALDIARTLFAVAGGEIPAEVRGIDLIEFAKNTQRPKRRIYFEHSDLHQVGCTDEEHSAIYSVVDYLQLGAERRLPAGTLQLFDARGDRRQEHDLEGQAPQASAKYRELLQLWRASALNRATAKGPLSAEQEARLQQLGY